MDTRRGTLWLGFLAAGGALTGTSSCQLLDKLGDKSADAGVDAQATVTTATATASANTPEPTAQASASAAPVAEEPFSPPGACVDPVKDAKKRFSSGVEPSVEEIGDLDGDGKKDKTVGFLGMGMNWPYEIYVMRGSCGHFVGEISGNGVKMTGLKSKGLKSLGSNVTNPCLEPCGCFNQEVSWYFNGKEYAVGKSKDIPMNEPCDAGKKAAPLGAIDAGSPAAAVAYKVGDKLTVEWHGTTYPATVIQVAGKDQYKIHYDSYDKKWDEVVGPSRIKGRR